MTRVIWKLTPKKAHLHAIESWSQRSKCLILPQNTKWNRNTLQFLRVAKATWDQNIVLVGLSRAYAQLGRLGCGRLTKSERSQRKLDLKISNNPTLNLNYKIRPLLRLATQKSADASKCRYPLVFGAKSFPFSERMRWFTCRAVENSAMILQSQEFSSRSACHLSTTLFRVQLADTVIV